MQLVLVLSEPRSPEDEDAEACTEGRLLRLGGRPAVLPSSSPESLFIIIKLHSWQPIKQDILFLTTCSSPSSTPFCAINLSALPEPLKAFWLLYNGGQSGVRGCYRTVCSGALMPQHLGGERRGKGTGDGVGGAAGVTLCGCAVIGHWLDIRMWTGGQKHPPITVWVGVQVLSPGGLWNDVLIFSEGQKCCWFLHLDVKILKSACFVYLCG